MERVLRAPSSGKGRSVARIDSTSPGRVRFCGQLVPYAPAWQKLIDLPAFQRALRRAEARIKPAVDAGTCTPEVHDMLRFLQVTKVVAVVLGQDPYKQPGFASGSAFEVRGVKSWKALAKRAPKSEAAALKTLVRLFYMTATDWSKQRKGRPTFAEAAEAADRGDFYLLPPNKLFRHWGRSGILPLNASLSTLVDQSGAHRRAWLSVRRLIVKYITETWPGAVWFLWGVDAKRLAKRLPARTVIHEAGHPDLQGVSEASDQFFFKASGIPKTWESLKWTGPDQRKKHSVSITGTPNSLETE